MSEPAVALNEPWTTPERQQVAVHFGIWSFLATEALFFGAIFLFYAVARSANPAGFDAGAGEANFWFGTLNTFVLMSSSLTMAIAERATKEGLVRLARAMLFGTIVLGLTFVMVKGFEYKADIDEHLLLGTDFKLAMRGASQFWAFYWTVTIVHAIHLTIGLGLVARLLFVARADLPDRWIAAQGTALYWHLVDVVWVILYPMIYLVNR